MPRLAKPLTELQINKARAKAKTYTLPDGNGLYLQVSQAGAKSWSVRFRLPDGSRPSPATIGHYPTMSLAEARARAVQVQRDAKRAIATAGLRKARQEASATQAAALSHQEQQKAESQNATLRAVSGRWLAEKRPTWAPETYRKARYVVDSYFLPKLADADMHTLETKDVRPLLLAMHASTPALATKARQHIVGIVDQAINEGLRSDESALRLNRIFPKTRKGHMPSVTEDEEQLGEIMRAVDGYTSRVTRAALILTALTAARPGVVAMAEWSEIDLKRGEWNIPAAKMKTDQPFSTSIPTQALEALKEMKQLSNDRQYVFPPLARQKTPHLHRDSLSKALREMGFKDVHTTHGFRASFRTIGRERLNIETDVLEAQLAHAPRDEVQAAYARTKFKEKRREVMQEWADYLDKLKKSNVVPMKRTA